jgi:tetratricopeptide (TPR) repeat protein
MIPNVGKMVFFGTGNFAWLAFFLLLMGCSMSPNSSAATIAEPEKNGEAISFLGKTFFRQEDDSTTFLQKDSLLAEAITIYQTDTTDLNSIIWYGRRLASMYRFRDAITIFSAGISIHPEAPELFRHRGQLYIITRNLDAAIHDLSKAASLSTTRGIETEPDAIPNKLDLPLTNLRFNIYYYLGLTWYLKGDFQKAIAAFATCQSYSNNPDLNVATIHWLFLSYLKSGEKNKADALLNPISPDMEIVENGDYLVSLLDFKQQSSPRSNWQLSSSNHEVNAAHLYGFTCWLDGRNEPAKASALRRDILLDKRWFTIGYIAAEADSSRLLVQ